MILSNRLVTVSVLRNVRGRFRSALVGMAALLSGWSCAQAQTAPQVLKMQMRPVVAQHQAALVGAMPAEQQLNLSIVLPLRNQAALTSLLGRLYDPASPDYRKFLSVAEFTQQFGPTTDDYAAVVGFATANGFTVTGNPANRLIVPISGTAAQVNQAFHVQMNLYQHPTENRTFFSFDRQPSLDLTVPISYVGGLDDYSLPHPMTVRPQTAAQPLNVTGSGPGGSYLGSDMRAAYYGGTTLTGIGQAVGLVEFSGYTLSDVNSTFSNAGQTYSVPINNVLLDNAAAGPGTASGGEGEVVLDIVQAIGMAPGLSQVRVYIGNGPDQANVLNTMASENLAKQLSCSWGWLPADPTVEDVFFLEMAAQGQSFFSASGDDGAYDAALSPFFYPQEDGYVTAVGGTSLLTNGAGGSWASEVAWNSSPYYGTGGGISPDGIALPTYQNGVANSANGGSTTLRNAPDVAMEANFDNYSCELGSCVGTWAGTSFAAPRWAGFMALVNQQAVEAGNAPKGGVGFLNPPLYLLAQGSHYANDLHDITSGNNDTYNQPLYFNAVAGYDLTTGWGSPTGQSLIDDLAGPQVPGFFLGATPTSVIVNPGSSATVNMTVVNAGGFTGNVTLAVTSTLPTGLTAAFSPTSTPGITTLTLTAASNAPNSATPLTITGTSGNLTATTTVTANVHPPSFTLSAFPGGLSLNLGGSVTSTVTVLPQSGFTGSVNLAVSGLPNGVTATFSPASATTNSTLTLTASSTAAGGTSTLTITGTSGNLSATTTISLTVNTPSFSLYGPGSVPMGKGSSVSSYIEVEGLYGFSGSVSLVATGLPAGVTASFSPNPTTGYATMTLTANSSAPVGQSTVTVTGTSGNLTASTTFNLGIFTPTFTLSTGSVSVGQGTSSTTYVYLNAQYGFSGSVNMAVTGLPAGVTASFSPNPTTYSSTITITASSTAAVGQYTATITGTSGTQSATTSLSIGVFTPTFTLSNSGSLNVGLGTSSGYDYVYVTPLYGFTGGVNFSVAGLPAGVTATFSPNPSTSFTMMTLTASSNAALGQYNATITGTSGTQSATTQLTVGVYTPTFTLSGYGASISQSGTQTSYVYVNPQYGFTGSVNLAVTGLPSGVTASISSNPTTTGSAIVFTASNSAALGQFNVTITGTSGSQTASTTLPISVLAPQFAIYSSSVNMGIGTTASTYVSFTPEYGFTGAVALSVSGLPAGVTATISPNPISGIYSSTITYTTSSSAVPGTSTITITGTYGSQTATTTVLLGVFAPSFSVSAFSTYAYQGVPATGNIYVSEQYGFSGNVTLSLSGLPAGVSASLATNPTTSGSVVNFTIAANALVGYSNVTVTGTSGGQTMTTTLPLYIQAEPANLSASPASFSVTRGSVSRTTVTIGAPTGYTGSVSLTATGLPSGVTATFSPTSTSTSSLLSLSASNSAAVGGATVTITGTIGAQTVSTTVALNVLPAPGSTATSTSLALTANGNSASSVAAGTMITATATVTSGSTPVTQGLVNLCAATANPCDTLHVIGTAALTRTGSAVFRFVPGAGSRSYQAVFVGTSANPASTSGAANLSVTAAQATTTTIAQSGSAGNYTLTGTVTGKGSQAPSGKISFLDTSNGNSLLGTGSLGGGSSTLSVSSQSFSVSWYPTAIVTGDFNEDGIPDLILGNTFGSVQITLGNGDGTFKAPVVLLSSNAGTTLVGDFNRDGHLDLVVNVGAGCEIFLGNGDGTFGAPLPAVATGSCLAVGDFNGDGILDLVGTNYGNTVTFLGNGDGTFNQVTSTATSYYDTSMGVADFNGDGKLDLAVVNEGSAIQILLGNGDGTFVVLPTTFNVTSVDSVAIGDFNHDGKPDLILGQGSYTSPGAYVELGNGDGTFTAGATLAVTGPLTLVATADMNQDGNTDVITSGGQSGTLSYFFGKGDGTFSAGNSVTGGTIEGFAVGDWNGDGVPDVAFSSILNTNNLTILTSALNWTATATSTGIAIAGTGSTHTVDASYSGDTAYSASLSGTTGLTGTGGNPTGPAGYTYCAPENGTCNVTSTSSVAFGANGLFNYGTFSSAVSCSNSVFNDPDPGVVKACFYQVQTPPTPPTNPVGPSGYTYCAAENGTCNITSLSSVAFGANGLFNYGTFSAAVSCNTTVFGDPDYGTIKACFYQVQTPPTPPTTPTGPSGYTYCAAENGTCNITSLSSVAFGANGLFNYGTFSSAVSCNTTVFGDPDYGTVKACFYRVQTPPTPPATPVGPSGYTYCAPENGTCNITGLSSVAFGANGDFNYGTFSAAVSCSNSVFGDPDPGVVKACFYQVQTPTPPANPVGPSGYTYCAPENGTCNITSLSSVAFGANGDFNYASFSSPVSCSTAVFGDPDFGTVKACFYKPADPSLDPSFTFCAVENAICSFNGTATVAFGVDGEYNYGTFTNSVSCSNSVFGDPDFGVAKSCYYKPN